MLIRVPNSATFICFIEKRKRNSFIKTNNLHNSMFPSFNLFMFTEEDDITINNEDKRILNKKMSKFTQFCNF